MTAVGLGAQHLADGYELGLRTREVDAWTYLAAAERLTAGHDLYALLPTDRAIVVHPPYWSVPFTYPPLAAVLWAPMLRLPDPILAWYAGGWIVLLGTAVYVAARGGVMGALLLVALAPVIGQSLALGNVNLYLVGGLTVVWFTSRRPIVGVLVGLMAAVKLTPALTLLWLARQRRWRAVAIGVLTALLLSVLAAAVAGAEATLTYVEIARTMVPYPASLSGMTGLWWATPAALLVGSLGSIMTSRPGLSYSLVVLGLTFGSPAMFWPSTVTLMALGLPLTEPATFLAVPAAPERGPQPDDNRSRWFGQLGAK